MPSRISPATKIYIATQLAMYLIAAAILIPAVTPSQAVNGGLWVKLAFLGRVVALVALADWMLRTRSLGWSDVGLTRPKWRRLLIALPAGLVLVIAFNAAARFILVTAGLPTANYSMFKPLKGNIEEYLFWELPVSLGTAAFGEELIFRGFIAQALQKLIHGPRALALGGAVATQSVIFGGLHYYQGSGGVISAGLTGFALGLTWLIAGRNLWAGIAIHALLDGSAMTAIYLGYITT
jgi:membrane protease YdiL (CAAX protease family)